LGSTKGAGFAGPLVHLLHEEIVFYFGHLDTLLTYMKYAPLLLILLISVPFGADAASKRPSCELTVTSSHGETSFSKKATVFATQGETITLAWESENATSAKDSDGESISRSGSRSITVTDDESYTYTFNTGSKKVSCSVNVLIAEGAFDSSSLSNASAKPTVTGTAEGTKIVRVVISEKEGNHIVFTSKDIRVKRGEWSVKLNKSLDNDTYDISLYGDKRYKLNKLADGTLGIGTKVSASAGTGTGSLSASMLPLLSGGSAGPYGSVPVAYLKVTNTSPSVAFLAGVTLKQNGSANVSSVTSFSTVDDKALNRSSAIANFRNNVAYIPLNASILAGQTRIYSIKAQLGQNLAPGASLILDVQSLDTKSSLNASLPLRGVTWVLRGY